MCVMVGALVFLGCPIRVLLRLGGGDLSALVALAGLIAGVLGGGFLPEAGFHHWVALARCPPWRD